MASAVINYSFLTINYMNYIAPRIGGRGELLPADGAEGRLGIGALGVYADTGAFLPHLPPLQPGGAAAVLHQPEA